MTSSASGTAPPRRSQDPGTTDERPSAALLLDRGFRVFFALAALHTAILVPAWTALWMGGVLPGWLSPLAWHAHEMVFGFVAAAVAGFLLTAVPVWTGTPPIRGARLGVLGALWGGGRLAFALAAWLPTGLVAAVDLAFLPALTLALAGPLLRSGTPRHRGILCLLIAWCALGLALHAGALGWATGRARELPHLPVHLIVILVVVIGGRIVPLFTENALRRAGEVVSLRDPPQLAVLSVGALAFALALEAIGVAAGIESEEHVAALRLLAAALLCIRLAGWAGLRSLRDPLVGSMHLAFAWLPLGLTLEALSGLGAGAPEAAGLHALGIGGIGGMVLALLTRVPLGHTGRPLRAPWSATVGYVALTAAATLRVLGALVPSWAMAALVPAAALWTGTWLLYLWSYLPILWSSGTDTTPRSAASG